MGVGLAQALALAGCTVELVDVKERSAAESAAALDSARSRVAAGLAQLAAAGLAGADDKTVSSRIAYRDLGAARDALADCDIVFEAVPETPEAKESAFRHLAHVRGLIGSTTSTFAVEHLADLAPDPALFMNVHWLNPAPVIPLVEVMAGSGTSTDALEKMESFLRRIGKAPVRCNPSAGYIVPRIQALAMNEAARLVEEGVASAEDVDIACRLGFGIRFATMGLLEFTDWGGADVLLYASDYLAEALGSDRFEAPAILREKVAAGQLGVGSEQGFFDYRSRDVSAYQEARLRALVALLDHLDLRGPRDPGGTAQVRQ